MPTGYVDLRDGLAYKKKPIDNRGIRTVSQLYSVKAEAEKILRVKLLRNDYDELT